MNQCAYLTDAIAFVSVDSLCSFYVSQLHKVRAEIAEVANNPQSLLLEALHSAGYSGALGHPLLAPDSALTNLDGDKLAEFVDVSASSRDVCFPGHARIQIRPIAVFCELTGRKSREREDRTGYVVGSTNSFIGRAEGL